MPATVVQGDFLDIPGIVWSLQQDNNGRPLAASLRLVDDQGEVWASIDEPIGGNAQSDQPVRSIYQPMRLEIPEGTPPGTLPARAGRLRSGNWSPAGGHGWSAGCRHAGCPRHMWWSNGLPTHRPSTPFWPTSVRSAWWRPAHLPRPSARETRFRYRCSGRPRRIISPSRWLSSCSYWTKMGRSSLAWRRNRWPAGIRPRHGKPASWCRTGTHWSCRLARRQAAYQLIAGLYRAADGRRLETHTGPLGLRKSDHYNIKNLIVQ